MCALEFRCKGLCVNGSISLASKVYGLLRSIVLDLSQICDYTEFSRLILTLQDGV
jgi:hypothetical protein